MARILFVEDNLTLVEELAELLQAERPGIETTFAVDIPDSLTIMRKEQFDVIILDVMLPAYPGVPAQDEGIYLAAWILGKSDKLGPGLRGEPRPDWLADPKQRPAVMFLTSRTSATIHSTFFGLTSIAPEGVFIIERLRDDAYAHCQLVLKLLDETLRDGHDETEA